jgi:hypothetical protein
VGLAEAEVKPKTPAEVRARHPDLQKRFAVFDGRSTRPTLDERLIALWDAWSRAYDERGPVAAHAKLCGWLASDAERFQRSYARDIEAGVAASSEEQDPARRRAKGVWMRKRQRGEDVPPFDEWFRSRAAEFEHASSSTKDLVPEQHPADVDGPVDVRALLKAARPGGGARAGPSGGSGGGGAATTVTTTR